MFRKVQYISWLVVCVACIVQPLSIIGQLPEELNINQVNLRQFAAHPNISNIEQGEDGFMWIASDFGLYRFDGKHVRHYTKSAYPELPSDDINSILINHDNKIWIATDGGLAVLDPKNDLIQQHTIQIRDNTLNANLIPTCLFQASDSTIWLGLSHNRYARINSGNDLEIYKFEIADFPLGNCFEVKRMFEDAHGDIYMEAICAHSVAFVHIDMQSDHPTAKLMHKPEIGAAHMFAMNKKIFLQEREGLYQFNAESNQFDQLAVESIFADIPNFKTWVIKQESKTSFLVGGQKGRLVRCTIAQDTIFTEYIGKITDGRVQAIQRDRSGCIWLGTDDGAFFIPDRNPRFQNHLSSIIYDERYGVKMRAIIQDENGLIYTCTSQGIYRFNPFTSTAELILPQILSITQPYSMCLDLNNILWIGTDGYGLVKFDPHENKFYDRISAIRNHDQLGGSWICELVIDSEGTLWVGTGNGISYHVNNEKKLHIARDFNNKELLPNIFIHDIKESRKGQYWLGTSHGLYKMTRMGRLPDVYFILNKYDDVPYKIREICLTSGSDIWLATEDAGLVQYHTANKTQIKFNESSGLPSDVLYSLLPGPKGELWIGTFEGLARFDTTTHLVSNFFVTDGLPHNEFNSQSQLIASDGTIYMGTQNGMVSFNPMEFGIDSSDLPFMINGLIVHNTRLDSTYEESRFTQLTDRVHLGPHDNLVTISYSIADYNKPDGNRFQYLLEGLYTKWHYVGNQTELVLPHLPAGDYTLQLRGAGSDGRWSTQQATIPITVHAVYYNTWWFRLMSGVALMLIMWIIYRYRLSQVLKLQRIRIQIAEDLHDELGSSLTGIGIQTELLTVTEPSSTRASKLREISGHIQDAVSKLGDIVWSLQSDTGSLGDLMDRVEEQTHMMFVPGKIECQLSLPHDFRELQLNDVVKQNCFLIIKEALTNIVKHSNADKVTITMRCQEKELFMSIIDNGGKLPSSHSNEGGGNGLKNMQRRAKKMLSELTISRDNGFRIELIVPKAFA